MGLKLIFLVLVLVMILMNTLIGNKNKLALMSIVDYI